jgi:uncharacterized membrane protein YbaN (DUF454 family)
MSKETDPLACRYAQASESGAADSPVPEAVLCAPVRWGLIAFGGINVGLGIAGMFLPVMPTTVFLLMALWAFSKSSHRFHRWLYDHPRLGRPLRDWHAHRVIPRRAKILAVTMMRMGWLIVVYVSAGDWMVPAIVGACLLPVAAFIVTRRSHAPVLQA